MGDVGERSAWLKPGDCQFCERDMVRLTFGIERPWGRSVWVLARRAEEHVKMKQASVTKLEQRTGSRRGNNGS